MCSSTEFCFLSNIPIAVIEMEEASALFIYFSNNYDYAAFFHLFINLNILGLVFFVRKHTICQGEF